MLLIHFEHLQQNLLHVVLDITNTTEVCAEISVDSCIRCQELVLFSLKYFYTLDSYIGILWPSTELVKLSIVKDNSANVLLLLSLRHEPVLLSYS